MIQSMNYYSLAKTLICTAMVTGGTAYAGTNATIVTYQSPQPVSKLLVPVTPKAGTNPFQGSVSVGYATKYTSRGLAFKDSGSDNVIPVELLGKYQINDKCAAIAGIKYVWMTANRFDHGRANTGVTDEGSAFIGGEHKWNDKLTTSLYYSFVNGGIPGSLNDYGARKDSSGFIFNSSKLEEHSVVANIHYDFDKAENGWFVNSNVRYTFRWMSGWWFANTLGYQYEMTPQMSLVVSGTWNATAGYFAGSSLNANGTQGISLDVALPLKTTQNVTVRPFVSALWLGNGGMAANHRGATERKPYHKVTQVYRNFTPVFGVNAMYSF